MSRTRKEIADSWGEYLVGQIYIPDEKQRDWLKRQIHSIVDEAAENNPPIHFSGTHTNASKETEKKKLSGSFELKFETGEVTLNVDISNAAFDDVLFGFKQCRDEFQRQIDNREKCPFHKK